MKFLRALAAIFVLLSIFPLWGTLFIPNLFSYSTVSQVYHQGILPNGRFRTPFTAWGDSLTAGAGATMLHDFPTLITLTYGRAVWNEGVGGQTSTEIARRFSFGDGASKNAIIWAGRNNYSDANAVLADVRLMASNKDEKVLVLGILNADVDGERRGERGWKQIADLNAALAAEYKERFIPIREILIASASPIDKEDVVRDVVPGSLRSDYIHLNDEGEAIVANAVEAALRAKGW